jgi:hypothetical protein
MKPSLEEYIDIGATMSLLAMVKFLIANGWKSKGSVVADPSANGMADPGATEGMMRNDSCFAGTWLLTASVVPD